MNMFKKLFSIFKKRAEECKDKFPTLKDEYLLNQYCVKPQIDTLVLHMEIHEYLEPITYLLIYKSKNNKYYRLNFRENILRTYELFDREDKAEHTSLKACYSCLRDKMEEYPDRYIMKKDELRNVLNYKLY